jgi:hypothetical protein
MKILDFSYPSVPSFRDALSSPQVKQLALQIAQLAIRVLFSVCMFWMGAALLPLTGKALTLGALALGTSFLAASFFQPPSFWQPEPTALSLPRLPSLILLSQDLSVPKGIHRADNNCWVNTILQLLQASSPFSQWIRRGEAVPESLEALRFFYQAYDKAVELGSKSVESPSQTVREMISQLTSSISSDSRRQEDADEGLTPILDLYAQSAPVYIKTSAHYNTAAVPILDCPSGIREAREPSVHLSLAINKNSSAKLEQMLKDYFQEIPYDLTIEEIGIDGALHRYRADFVQRQYETAPPELWIQIKRFGYEGPSESYLSSIPWLGQFFPRKEEGAVKNDASIEIPDEIVIHPIEGPPRTYKLNAHGNHEGSCTGGHYKAYRWMENQLYCCDDAMITPVAPQDLERVRSAAYLLHYELAALPEERDLP